MSSVPIIDLDAMDAATLSRLDEACRDHGFFLLRGHGIDAELDAMWQASASFFAAPREVKQAVMRSADNPLGYFDRELTKRKRDQKEVFDFRLVPQTSSRPMRWPDLPGFETALRGYFDACTGLSERVLGLVCRAAGWRDDALSGAFGERHTSTARLNWYPVDDPVAAAERAELNALGDMALHHHTDPGGITLLAQDDVGGLQTRSLSGEWIDVPPAPGTLVVNLGDVMQVWTNDRYRAAVHRVTARAPGKARLSTAYFYQPHSKAEILPGIMEGIETDARYRAFSWREFIQGRIDDNFADAGAEDIQIARYRAS